MRDLQSRTSTNSAGKSLFLTFHTRIESEPADCLARLADDIDTEGVRVVQQAGIPGEVENLDQVVPPMPRAQNGIGRRYKKRRTSPASTIEVEQIEEEGVEELVVVEEETEEVAEIAIVEFGEDVVMWVLVHMLEKVWAHRDWQAYRFVRYATLTSARSPRASTTRTARTSRHASHGRKTAARLAR